MTPPPLNPVNPNAEFAFIGRVPSQNWEPASLPGNSQQLAWVWFKPPHAPHGFVVRFPDEAWQTNATDLTIRQIVQGAGVDPGLVAMWQLYGMAYHGMNGTNPLMDQPIPPPPAGAVAEILIMLTTPTMRFVSPLPMNMTPMNLAPMTLGSSIGSSTAGVIDGNLTELFERLDVEWNSVIEIEKDLERLRKMLVDLSSRMKILNRDLSSDERLYSSREDKQDWQDCRRMLRDSENRLRACVKEFDIGDPSSAGYRRSLEQIYEQFVKLKIPFAGMEQTLGQFEGHRKLVMTLQGKMNNAYLGAVQNGERRAQQVLARIAGKVREAGTKKTALGVMLDG